MHVNEKNCIHGCCLQAHRNNYTYPRYAWILYGWYPNYWWVSNELSACKANDLKHFLERALAVDVPPFSDGKTDIGTVSYLSLFTSVSFVL